MKQKEKLFSKLISIVDISVTILSFFVAYLVRDTFPLEYFSKLSPIKRYAWMLLLIIPLWWVLFKLFKLDRFQLFKESIIRTFWRIFQALFIGNIMLTSSLFFLKQYYISRPLMLMFATVNLGFIFAERAILRLYLMRRSTLRKEHDYHRTLIAGTNESARRVIRSINQESFWGTKIIGLVKEAKTKTRSKFDGYHILGIFSDIPMLIEKMIIDEVIFCVDNKKLEKLKDVVEVCENMGITTSIVCNFLPVRFSQISLLEIQDNLPILRFSPVPVNEIMLFLKRTIDILISSLLIILLSPLFLTSAVLIKLTSKGPIIFKQVRGGLNGRRFILYKFRSMVVDAEQKKKQLGPLNIMKGPAFKIPADPRLTKAGRFLRRFSLDELPQLWNVLKGDMSLVGPRPQPYEEVKQYKLWQRRRLSMRPGLTCIWQIYGRNLISDFDEWVKFDLEYIDTWSLALDFKIMLKTIPIVIKGKGAV